MSETYNRSFLGIGDYLAYIGGIVKALHVIFFVTIGYFMKKYMVIQMANYFYDVEP